MKSCSRRVCEEALASSTTKLTLLVSTQPKSCWAGTIFDRTGTFTTEDCTELSTLTSSSVMTERRFASTAGVIDTSTLVDAASLPTRRCRVSKLGVPLRRCTHLQRTICQSPTWKNPQTNTPSNTSGRAVRRENEQRTGRRRYSGHSRSKGLRTLTLSSCLCA